LTGALDQHPKEQVWNRIATERFQRGVWALSISGDGSTLAVSEALSGCVKIFTVHPWLLMCELCGDSPYFGSSSSLSHNGKHVAINEIVPRALGYVRVYTCIEDLCDSKSWALVGQEMLGRSPQDLFGKSLSLSADGNFLAVGAPGSTAASHVDGKVYLYSYNGTHWDLETTFSSIETPEMFGAAVSLSRKGDIIAIGAPSLYPSTGTIAVYQRDTELETWQPLGVPIYGSHEGAALGQVVSLGVHHETNFTVASRSQSLSESQSSAQVFRYSDEHLHWISMRNNSVKDDGEEIAVDMASDGSLFAVGADRTFRLYEINASGDDWIRTPGFLAGGKHIAIADQQPGGIIRLAAIGETEIDSFLVVYEGAEEGKSAQ
jgi:WD40 repeat protein